MKPKPRSLRCVVVPIPCRTFLVDVTYKVRLRHRVTATDADEARMLAPGAEIAADMEILDIVEVDIVSRAERT